MSSSSKMVLISLFLFFSVTIFAKIGGSQDGCQVQSRCGEQGPWIRFPFRLKDQLHNCGYPGFELACVEKNQTMLELPNSVKLLVKWIDYKYQEIVVQDPYNCPARQLQNLNSTASLFYFKLEYNVELDFTIFNCSSPKEESYYFRSIRCASGNWVYAVPSSSELSFLDLFSCHGIYRAYLPYQTLNGEGYFTMNWNKSICENCEAQGMSCRLKSQNKKPETECIPKEGAGAPTLLIGGIILGFFILILLVLVAICYTYCSNKSGRENQIKIETFLEDYKALKPSRYSYVDIKKITNKFKEKLGEGGYGTVYKGKLSNDILVAVKVLNNSKGNGEEFINEVGTIGRIHHVNVVRLVGFCADGSKRALIYEFLPNESLEKFIFSAAGENHSLGWEKLQHIAIGIAKGIEYLHQGCDQRILHFDIKPHNILLDHNFNPKISDFGLAKLCSKEESVVSMTVARGTIGYIAPEVLSRNFGNASHKSDVYSFGMVLLEMVGGRKNTNVTVESTDQGYFPEWVYCHLNQGRELNIQIEKEGDTKIAKKLTVVGLWCIQWYPVDRPSMKVVVQMLEGEGDNLTMPPNPFASLGLTTTNMRGMGRLLQYDLPLNTKLE